MSSLDKFKHLPRTTGSFDDIAEGLPEVFEVAELLDKSTGSTGLELAYVRGVRTSSVGGVGDSLIYFTRRDPETGNAINTYQLTLGYIPVYNPIFRFPERG
ncbi:MAG: hypothetical protein ABIF88_03035 [archaeon]